MVLWHLGTAAAIVYVTLGRRRIDYRMVLVGAILPDVFDGILELLFLNDGTIRYAGHSLVAPIVVGGVIILGSRGERRLSLFGIAVGWLLHLVADGMWNSPETFLWPAFGLGFSDGAPEPYSLALVLRPWDHLWLWVGELAGAAALAWFWVAFRFGDGGRLRLFLKDGYLRP